MTRRNFLKAAAAAVLGLFGVGAAKAAGTFTIKGPPVASGKVVRETIGYRPSFDPKDLSSVAALPPKEIIDSEAYRFAYAGPIIRPPKVG